MDNCKKVGQELAPLSLAYLDVQELQKIIKY